MNKQSNEFTFIDPVGGGGTLGSTGGQEARKSGGQAIIGGQSPQETCHCEGVKRPLQSHNSEVLSIIKPHPSPLPQGERERYKSSLPCEGQFAGERRQY